MSDAYPEGLPLRLAWLTDPAATPTVVNQISLLPGPGFLDRGTATDLFYMHIGHVNPPMLSGDMNEEDLDSYVANNVLPVVETGNFVITLDRLREFHAVIGKALGIDDE
jgi:hypothetical protein